MILRFTAAQWTSDNPVISSGCVGYETDTHLGKLGNGIDAWAALPYIASNGSGGTAWGAIAGTLSAQTDLQSALDLKSPIASPTFTGTIGGITKSMVGLGNVANTDTSTTTNITDATNKRFCTDAQKTVIGNTSGVNTGDNATNSQYSGLAIAKQDVLVSATNIKTINGASVLGSGDLAVVGGSGLSVGLALALNASAFLP